MTLLHPIVAPAFIALPTMAHALGRNGSGNIAGGAVGASLTASF